LPERLALLPRRVNLKSPWSSWGGTDPLFTGHRPRSRCGNVQELSADVSRYLDGLAVAAHCESVFEKAGRFYRRYRFFILLIAAYLLMRLILLLALKR
jgi:hypothetical protein